MDHGVFEPLALEGVEGVVMNEDVDRPLRWQQGGGTGERRGERVGGVDWGSHAAIRGRRARASARRKPAAPKRAQGARGARDGAGRASAAGRTADREVAQPRGAPRPDAVGGNEPPDRKRWPVAADPARQQVGLRLRLFLPLLDRVAVAGFGGEVARCRGRSDRSTAAVDGRHSGRHGRHARHHGGARHHQREHAEQQPMHFETLPPHPPRRQSRSRLPVAFVRKVVSRRRASGGVGRRRADRGSCAAPPGRRGRAARSPPDPAPARRPPPASP